MRLVYLLSAWRWAVRRTEHRDARGFNNALMLQHSIEELECEALGTRDGRGLLALARRVWWLACSTEGLYVHWRNPAEWSVEDDEDLPF